MQLQLRELLHKELTRKEFLKVLGLGLAGLFGLSALMRLASYKHRSGSPAAYGR